MARLAAAFRFRSGVGAGRAASGAVASEPGQGLATNVCVGCHSPASGPALSGRLTGRWLSPNITPDPVSGIGAWSRDDLFSLFSRRQGARPRAGRRADGPCRRGASGQLRRRPQRAGRLARAPARASRSGRPDLRERARRAADGRSGAASGTPRRPDRRTRRSSGAALYNASCASCHGADGAGSPGGDSHRCSATPPSGAARPTTWSPRCWRASSAMSSSGAVFMQSFDGRRGAFPAACRTTSSPPCATSSSSSSAIPPPRRSRGSRSRAPVSPGGARATPRPRGASSSPSAAGRGARRGLLQLPRARGARRCRFRLPAACRARCHYFAKQMRDYASGARPHGAMSSDRAAAERGRPPRARALLRGAAGRSRPSRWPRPMRSLLQAGETLYASRRARARHPGLRGLPRACRPRLQSRLPVARCNPPSYTAGQLRLWRERHAAQRSARPHGQRRRAR